MNFTFFGDDYHFFAKALTPSNFHTNFRETGAFATVGVSSSPQFLASALHTSPTGQLIFPPDSCEPGTAVARE